MRVWLIVGGLLVVALLVVLIPRLGSEEPHTPRPGNAETVPAAIALTYARGVQVGDTAIACGTMTADAARAVGCGTAHPRPRGCGDFSIPGTRIIHFDESHATVDVGTCRIDLVPGTETQWAVSSVASRLGRKSAA